ncbi:MAG: bifunctional pyr operon transcriptional regulator/uracil phosphoribosyltransferase PyrR [Thiobacillus sp.]
MADLLPDVDSLIARLADAIQPHLTPDTALVGIYSGGVWIAERLHQLLYLATPLGMLSITHYRDDFSRIGLHPQIKPSHLPFEVEGRNIILVDDVFYTGRTVRGAMHELFDYGRPASIKLAVLVNRGGHELPIFPDFTGLHREIPAGQSLTLSREDNGSLIITLA